MSEESFEYRLIGRMKLQDNKQTMTLGAFVTPEYREGENFNYGIGTYYRLIKTSDIYIPNLYMVHYFLNNGFGLIMKKLVEKFIEHFKLIMKENIYTPGNEDFITYLAISMTTFTSEEKKVIILYRLLMLEIQFKKEHEVFSDYVETKWGKDIPHLMAPLYQKYNDILMENSENNDIAFAMRNVDMNANACICEDNLVFNCPITIEIRKKFKESIITKEEDLNYCKNIEKIRFTACVNKRTLVISIDSIQNQKTIIYIGLITEDASGREFKGEYVMFAMKIFNLIKRSHQGKVVILEPDMYKAGQFTSIKNIGWKYRTIKDERNWSILTKYNHFEVENLVVTLRLKYYCENNERAWDSWKISQNDEFDILLMMASDGYNEDLHRRKSIINFSIRRLNLLKKYFPPTKIQLHNGFNSISEDNASTRKEMNESAESRRIIVLNRPNKIKTDINISGSGKSVENGKKDNLVKPEQQLGIEQVEQNVEELMTSSNETFSVKDARGYRQAEPTYQTSSNMLNDRTSEYMISITDEPLNLTTYGQSHQSIAMSCTRTELNKSENYSQSEPLDLTINKEVYIKMKVEK